MNSLRSIDQVLDFYRSYMVENLPFLILLVFFVLAMIFMLRFPSIYKSGQIIGNIIHKFIIICCCIVPYLNIVRPTVH